jgi:hypothetical protein
LATYDEDVYGYADVNIPMPSFLSVKCLVLKGDKMLSTKSWMQLPWQYGTDVQYLKIEIGYFFDEGPKFKNLETLLQHLPNLKGICIDEFESVHEVDFWNLYDTFLENRGINDLDSFEFDEKVEKLSKHLPFTFHLESRHSTQF